MGLKCVKSVPTLTTCIVASPAGGIGAGTKLGCEKIGGGIGDTSLI